MPAVDRKPIGARPARALARPVALLVLLVLLASGLGVAQADPGDDDWLDDDRNPIDDASPTDSGDSTDDEPEASAPGALAGSAIAAAVRGLAAAAATAAAPLDLVELARDADPTERRRLLELLSDTDDPAATTLWTEALAMLRAGRQDEALSRLRLFVEAFPDDVRAVAAREILVAKPYAGDALGAFVAPEVPAHGEPAAPLVNQTVLTSDRGGTVEIVVVGSLVAVHGGVAAAALVDDDDNQVTTGILTAAGGVTAAFIVANFADISAIEAQLFDIGWVVGAWHGFALQPIVAGDPAPELDAWSYGFLTGVAGVTIAEIIGAYTDVDEGDVALAASGGLWGTFFGGMALAAFVENTDDAAYPILLASTDLGLVALGVASGWIDTSRERMAIIDLCGALGAVTASSILFVGYGEDGPPRGVFGVTNMITAAVGIGLAAWLTDSIDAAVLPPAVYESAEITIDLPSAFVAPTEYRGQRGLQVGLNLLDARF